MHDDDGGSPAAHDANRKAAVPGAARRRQMAAASAGHDKRAVLDRECWAVRGYQGLYPSAGPVVSGEQCMRRRMACGKGSGFSHPPREIQARGKRRLTHRRSGSSGVEAQDAGCRRSLPAKLRASRQPKAAWGKPLSRREILDSLAMVRFGLAQAVAMLFDDVCAEVGRRSPCVVVRSFVVKRSAR